MSISQEELLHRTTHLRNTMKQEGFDAFIIYADEYRSGCGTYLTNYKPINVIEESPQVIFLVGDLSPIVFLGRLNCYAAKDVIWMQDVRPMDALEGSLADILRSISNHTCRIGLIGYELMPVKLYDVIRGALPKADFLPVTRILSKIRQLKSDAEVALMEKAAGINDEVLRDILKRCHVGQTERQVSAEMEYAGHQMGADLGSATVVMSGPNTQYPAWRPSERVIEPGDFVLVDFNPAVDYYCNDGGITILMPGGTTEQAEALTAGHKVLKDVIARIEPGMPASLIYELMLERLGPLGYSDNFVPYARGQRGVGHGVGLDVVEFPNFSLDSDFLLRPGMTFAVKLDLHNLAGGGYRIEVVVCITETGVRPLNKLVLTEEDDFTILR